MGPVAKNRRERKFVVCNADEGDPGAFMDRCVLESDPHRVLEGMAIAGYAVGASQGYIYVRGEYPLAVAGSNGASASPPARHSRRRLFDTPFNFRIDLRIGAGAFVCGEETALIASIEGQRGLPRPRPPYPAERVCGVADADQQCRDVRQRAADHPQGGRLVRVNRHGEEQGNQGFRPGRQGGEHRTGRGADGHDAADDRRGDGRWGARRRHDQGGADWRPVRRLHPGRALDTPVDYESLVALGSIMGSGGMIVMDQTNNMVDVAKYFMEFCMDESCGKCIPCRAGTVQMHRCSPASSTARRATRDLQQMEALCDMVCTPAYAGWDSPPRIRC